MSENNKRLELLFRKHNTWLRQVCWNICKDEEMVNDLVSELYLYLAENGNENLYYSDGTFNLGYCNSFLKSRFINKVKVQNRHVEYEPDTDIEEEYYDEEYDSSLENAYDGIKKEFKRLQSTDKWASAKIAELYYFGKGTTIEKLAEEIGVSKSTIFLHIKSMKQHIRNEVTNPFKDNDEES